LRIPEFSRSEFLNAAAVACAAGLFLFGCAASPEAEVDTEAVPRGLRLSTPGAAQGYVYYTPLISSTTYLVETGSGDVVHTWESDYAPSGFVYLLDNGNLLRGARQPDVAVFSGGGQGGRLQELAWDGEVVWDYEYASEDYLLHHDVAVLPNGNILAITWEAKSLEEVQQMGIRPEMTPEGGLWPDMIVELGPRPPDGARIVWEWHMWDHLIQNRDAALSDYGDLSEHPELIDINGGGQPPDDIYAEDLARYRELGHVPDSAEHDPPADLMHTNAIAYNAALDQIAVSMQTYSEIWIIDHSTTTEEARGHTGGRWGRGGYLLYRWGNPRNYERGDETDQRLFGQHDVRWVAEGLPGAGNILVFSNNVTEPDGVHSAVLEIEAPTDGDGRYLLNEGEPFGPTTPTWSYTAPDPPSFLSPFISGAHRLADGQHPDHLRRAGTLLRGERSQRFHGYRPNPWGSLHHVRARRRRPAFDRRTRRASGASGRPPSLEEQRILDAPIRACVGFALARHDALDQLALGPGRWSHVDSALRAHRRRSRTRVLHIHHAGWATGRDLPTRGVLSSRTASSGCPPSSLIAAQGYATTSRAV
jgi:hypothetical protein